MPYPSKFTQELFDEICARLAKGEPLAQICRDDHMPAANTVRDWCDSNKDLAIAYARAREEGFDAIALDALYIADDNGQDTRYGKDGQEMPDSEWISRSKLRVETRLKLLAKWDPRRYGDKLETTLQGPNGGPVQTNTVLGLDPSQFSAEFLKELAEKKV